MWQTERVYSPYLVNIYEKGQTAIPDYDTALRYYGCDPATLALPAKVGEVLNIVWLNDNGKSGGLDIHPFHAYGGHYWDLGSDNGPYNAADNEEKFQTGYVLVKRDTTMLHRYAASGVTYTTAGWRAWRIKLQNPGTWVMHCHILAHMITSLLSDFSSNFLETIAGVVTAEMQPMWTLSDKCQSHLSGSAYGNETRFPTVTHYHS